MQLTDLTIILKSAVEVGVNRAFNEGVFLQDYLKKSDAYKLYGRSIIDRWIREGLIQLQSLNGEVPRKFIDRRGLEELALSSNRVTYLQVADRS